jgi:hypothetical protein
MTRDPQGYYATLGVNPDAPPAAIAAAFRRRARILHPDVPRTGDAASFIALKAAYDLLADPGKRAAYDRRGREAEPQPDSAAASEPEDIGAASAYADLSHAPNPRQPRFSDVPKWAWIALAALLLVSSVQLVRHLTSPTPQAPHPHIRPNAPTVPATPPSPPAQPQPKPGPLSSPHGSEAMAPPPPAQPAPSPPRLAGAPTHYVVPAANPTVLWLADPARNTIRPAGIVPEFTPVQVVRLARPGVVEVKLSGSGAGPGLLDAARLTPGDAAAARRASCAYRAGPLPSNGEVLALHGNGTVSLRVRNRGAQPAVLKLRNREGRVVLAVFLAPYGEATLDGLPDAPVRPEFAIGELWSRACSQFAAGMRAQRAAGFRPLPALTPVSIPPEAADGASLTDISDQAFGQE